MKDKDKITKARNLLIEATKLLSDSIEGQEGTGKSLEDWMQDRVELWCRIYNLRGLITQDRLKELWVGVMKKDMRGIGGFFVGKGASLAHTPDDKVVLTKKASESIRAWTGKEISEYAKKFK